MSWIPVIKVAVCVLGRGEVMVSESMEPLPSSPAIPESLWEHPDPQTRQGRDEPTMKNHSSLLICWLPVLSRPTAREKSRRKFLWAAGSDGEVCGHALCQTWRCLQDSWQLGTGH